ncbi:MAG: hypothetical protein AAF790_09215 [Planctomycetota bacterium]
MPASTPANRCWTRAVALGGVLLGVLQVSGCASLPRIDPSGEQFFIFPGETPPTPPPQPAVVGPAVVGPPIAGVAPDAFAGVQPIAPPAGNPVAPPVLTAARSTLNCATAAT